MFEALAPQMAQPQRMVFETLADGWPGRAGMAQERSTTPFVRTTTALTMFNAGVKNVVPQRAAVVNFRLLPGDSARRNRELYHRVVDDPW